MQIFKTAENREESAHEPMHPQPSLQATSSAVDDFLGDLGYHLRRGLSSERARTSVSEIEAHLRERCAELRETGITPEAAEVEALRGFGSARQFAWKILHSATLNRFSAPARRAVLVLTGILLLYLFPHSDRSVEEALQTVASRCASFPTVALLLLIFGASLAGRQFSVRSLLTATGAVATAAFLLGGFLYVYPRYPYAYRQPDITRTEARQESHRYDRWIEVDKDAIRLCKEAIAFYHAPTGKIPTDLIERRKYIAPRLEEDRETYLRGNEVRRVPYYTYLRLLPTEKEAKLRWNIVGAKSYRFVENSRKDYILFRKGFADDATTPWGNFDFHASLMMAWGVLQTGLLAIAWNITGVFLGRFVFRRRLRRKMHA